MMRTKQKKDRKFRCKNLRKKTRRNRRMRGGYGIKDDILAYINKEYATDRNIVKEITYNKIPDYETIFGLIEYAYMTNSISTNTATPGYQIVFYTFWLDIHRRENYIGKTIYYVKLRFIKIDPKDYENDNDASELINKEYERIVEFLNNITVLPNGKALPEITAYVDNQSTKTKPIKRPFKIEMVKELELKTQFRFEFQRDKTTLDRPFTPVPHKKSIFTPPNNIDENNYLHYTCGENTLMKLVFGEDKLTELKTPAADTTTNTNTNTNPDPDPDPDAYSEILKTRFKSKT